MSCEDRISELHDDLLLKILSEIPTKDVVTTMVLSKRWRFVWTKVPKLEYKDTREEGNSRVWWLIEKSLQHHKAHVLESLRIQVDLHSNDAILRKRVSYSLDHYVRELALCLPLYRTQILYLPRNVYTSKTLVKLTLAGNRFVVDVPSLPCLPSLQTLVLQDVVYKDENSHVRLLATCPALSCLEVFRDVGDNVTRFIVKVTSLKSFTYSKLNISDSRTTSLVLDSPGLRHLDLFDPFRDHGSIQNMPHLEMAYFHYPNDKILRSFSTRILHLSLGDVACCSTINFPRLIKFELNTFGSNSSECSLGLLMIFLHNSPILKELTITSDVGIRKPSKVLPFLCNQQSSVPGCLLSHLETFVWGDFEGRRHERDFVAYILANSKCLKTATVSLGENERMVVDLKSMYRVSATSQLKIHFVGLYSTNPGRATT